MKIKSRLQKMYNQIKQSPMCTKYVIPIYVKYIHKKQDRINKKLPKLGIDLIIEYVNTIENIYIPASVIHQKVFPKYKGINRGKTVVLVGTAPTYDYYTPIEGAVHIGMNRAFMRSDIQLDYLFCCDKEECDEGDEIEQMMNEYKGNNCKKLYGYRYRVGRTLPMYFREEDNAESFYVVSHDYSIFGKNFDKQFFFFPPDISVSPLKSYGTTMFCAFQFALWTHPDKIYIVGCDCSTGHSSVVNDDSVLDFTFLIEPWKEAKKFADEYYPDVEITSINPVGLKGMFNDLYTENYKEKEL